MACSVFSIRQPNSLWQLASIEYYLHGTVESGHNVFIKLLESEISNKNEIFKKENKNESATATKKILGNGIRQQAFPSQSL